MSVELAEYMHAVKNWHLVVIPDMTRQERTKLVKLRQWCIAKTGSVYGHWMDSPGSQSEDLIIDPSGYSEWGTNWQFFFKDVDVAVEFKLIYQTLLDDSNV